MVYDSDDLQLSVSRSRKSRSKKTKTSDSLRTNLLFIRHQLTETEGCHYKNIDMKGPKNSSQKEFYFFIENFPIIPELAFYSPFVY